MTNAEFAIEFERLVKFYNRKPNQETMELYYSAFKSKHAKRFERICLDWKIANASKFPSVNELRIVDNQIRDTVYSGESKLAALTLSDKPMDRVTFEQGKAEIEERIKNAQTPKIKRFHEMCLRGHIAQWNKSQGLPYEAIITIDIPEARKVNGVWTTMTTDKVSA